MKTDELMRIDMNLLRVLHRIYISSSVSVAASELGMTQPGISHALRRLRQLFGDRLFVRSGARLTSTARADLLFTSIEKVMGILEHEVAILAGFDPATSGRNFVLGMGDLSEVKVIPDLLRLMRLEAPHCTLEIKRIAPSQMAQRLNDGSIELGIGIMPPSGTEHLFQQRLFTADYSVLAWKQHPRLHEPFTWDQYAAEEHVVGITGSDENLRMTILEPLGIKRRVRLNVEGFLSIPWLLQNTDAIATVPARMSDTITAAAELSQYPLPPSPFPGFSIQSIWHARYHEDAGHQWLRASLFRLMRGESDERYASVQRLGSAAAVSHGPNPIDRLPAPVR